MSDLLPANSTPAERALSEAIARISDVPTMSRQVWNPQTIPSSLLPWLAWAFGVDDWDTNWSDAQKRGAISTSVAVHRKKGTIGAVKTALASLGFDVQVQEWFNQTPAAPEYTFRLLLNVDQVGISQGALERILAVVESTKNLRSHLGEIVPGITTKSRLHIGGVAMIGSDVSIRYVGPNGSPLILDGSWILDGTETLDGIRGMPLAGSTLRLD